MGEVPYSSRHVGASVQRAPMLRPYALVSAADAMSLSLIGGREAVERGDAVGYFGAGASVVTFDAGQVTTVNLDDVGGFPYPVAGSAAAI